MARKLPPLCTVSEPDINDLPSIKSTKAALVCDRRRSSSNRALPSIQVPRTPASPNLGSATPGHRRFKPRPSPLLPPTPYSCATPSTRGDALGGARTPATPKVRFESKAIAAKQQKARFVGGSFRLNSKLGHEVFGSKIVRKHEIASHLQAFSGMRVGRDGTVSSEDFIKHLEKHDPALRRHAHSIYSTLCPGGQPLNFRMLIHGLYPAAKKEDIEALARIAMSGSKNLPRPSSPPVRGIPSKRDIQYATEVYQFWNKSGSGLLNFRECEAGLVETGMNDKDIDNALDELFSNEYDVVSLKNFIVWFSATM